MAKKDQLEQEKIAAIAETLEDLQFGEVHIIVHEGKVVQINRIDKQRFPI